MDIKYLHFSLNHFKPASLVERWTPNKIFLDSRDWIIHYFQNTINITLHGLSIVIYDSGPSILHRLVHQLLLALQSIVDQCFLFILFLRCHKVRNPEPFGCRLQFVLVVASMPRTIIKPTLDFAIGETVGNVLEPLLKEMSKNAMLLLLIMQKF